MANSWIRPGGVYTEVGADGVASPSVGYVTESASAPAVGTITLDEFAQYCVFEGASGSAQITLSGSHTGPTDTIEYRIETVAGEPVTSWATLQASVAAGAYSGTVTVPRGGWYLARVRRAADTAAEDVQTQQWGVGVIVGGMGQSQIVIWNGNNTYVGTPNPRAVIHDGTAWSLMTTSGRYRNTFAEALVSAMDCPVAVIVYGQNGSAIEQWYDSVTGKKSNYTTWESRITAAGGKISALIWWQGEGDMLGARTKAAYKLDLDALIAQIRTDYGATVPVVMPHLGRYTDVSAVDADMEAIRDAQVDTCNDSARNYGITTIQYALDDVIHFGDAGQLGISARLAQCIAHAFGAATYARSPRIGGAVLVDPTTIDVSIIHDGGTDITPVTGITGFSVLDGGTPVTISSAVRLTASKVRLTLASALTGTATVRYGYGANPNVSGILKDNTSLALALETTDADLLAAGRKVLLNCIQRVGGAAAASVTGLRWAFFDQSVPNSLTAPAVTGTGESTDGSGVLEIDVSGTALNVGDTGYLVIDTAAGVGFCGPVEVSG